MTRLVPASIEHFKAIEIRKEQSHELIRNRLPHNAFTILDETDYVVAIIWTYPVTTSTCHVCGYFSQRVADGRYTRDVLSFCKYMLRALLPSCSRVQFSVDSTFEKAYFFARKLGFKADCLMRDYNGYGRHNFLMSRSGVQCPVQK